MKTFFNRHYGAQNLTFVLYGDFDTKQATDFANKYLTQIPAREKSIPLTVKEPKQTAEKRFTVDYDATPMMMISYHVPAASHPDSELSKVLP